MLDVTLCLDHTEDSLTAYGALNPDAVAVAELLDINAMHYRRTRVRVTLTSGREIYVALQGAELTSDRDEHRRRWHEFMKELTQAKSPMAAL